MSNGKINFAPLMQYKGKDYEISYEVLKEYIPDLPDGIALYILAEQCEAEPFDPITVVRTQIGYSDEWSYAASDYGATCNCEFDIRCPEKFDYIAWLRTVFEYGEEQIDSLLDKLQNRGSGALPKVQVEILRTVYYDWFNSWIERGAPIYTEIKTVDKYNEHGMREQVWEEYPLDPNLTASERK